MRLKISMLFAVLLALPFVACQKNDDHSDNNEAAAAAAQVAFRACKDKFNYLTYNYVNECDQVKASNSSLNFAEWMQQKYGANWNQNYYAYPNYAYPTAYPYSNNNNVPTTPYNQSQTSYDAVQYFRYLRTVNNSDDFRQIEMDWQFLASRPQ